MTARRRSFELGAVLAAGALLLVGCGGDQDELQQWMEQQKREVKPNVEPLSAPKKFNPQPYMAMNMVEPFSTQKLTVALKQEARQPNSLLAAEINRRKEPLEAYPVDSMAMVGSVTRNGQPYALLRVDSLLYQVKQGDYLGQNYGKITKISGNQRGLSRNRARRGRRMDRAQQRPPASGEGAMTSMWEKPMAGWRSRFLALAMTAGAALPVWADNAVQAITSSQQAGAEVIRIEMSEPLTALPAGFTVQAPPRIAIDLPGVTNAMGKSSVDINQGNLRSVNVAQAGDRTRLVLNLKQPAGYRAQIDGKVLVVTLENTVPPTLASSGGQTTRFAESLNHDQLPLRGIDFRRGADGAGRVIVELPNNQVGVDIRQQGNSLVVEFLRSSLPDALRRRLDVTDFGTPIQSVTTTQIGDRVRMLVEPRGVWEHSAYQSDNQFVLEVRPQKVDP